MEFEKLYTNQFSYCFSLIELTSADDYNQVYVAGFAAESDICSSEWFAEYMKNKDKIEVDVSWYCTERSSDEQDASIRSDSLPEKIPNSVEMKCLLENLTDTNFYLVGSCVFNTENELER